MNLLEQTVALYKRSLDISRETRKARHHVVLAKRARMAGDVITARVELRIAEKMMDRIEGKND